MDGGHTLKINTNNARSSILYTPYSYTSIHWTHSLILQPELWRVKSLICTELSKIFLCTVCPLCLVLSGYKKGWCDCWRNVEGGDLGKKSAGAGRGKGMGWIYFKFTISSPPPATTLPDILANHENISVESSRRFWSVDIRFLSFHPSRHPAPCPVLAPTKEKYLGSIDFCGQSVVSREPARQWKLYFGSIWRYTEFN